MKKSLLCIPALLLLLLSACGRDPSVDEMLLHQANFDASIPNVAQADEYTGDYAPESAYSAGDLSSVSGIFYSSTESAPAALVDGKYFFSVNTFQTRKNDDGSTNMGTATVLKSMDLETGEAFCLCPDPLCGHPYRICPYTDLNIVGYYGGKLYVWRYTPDDLGGKWIMTIEALDPGTGVFTVVAKQEHRYKENLYTVLMAARVVKNRLFYTLLTVNEDPDSRSRTEKTEQYCLNLDTMETVRMTEDTPFIRYLTGSAAYGTAGDAAPVRTDPDFQNPVFLTPPEGYPVYGDLQADETTGEIFVLMLESERKYGVVCRLVGDGMEVLSLPHEKITQFQLTRDTIYYSAYDPAVLGTGRYGTPVTLDDGGKIYAADRAHPDRAECIFSDGVAFNMRRWFVLGDNLYLDSVRLVNENGTVYFSPADSLKHVRIHPGNHTVQYFRFE